MEHSLVAQAKVRYSSVDRGIGHVRSNSAQRGIPHGGSFHANTEVAGRICPWYRLLWDAEKEGGMSDDEVSRTL